MQKILFLDDWCLETTHNVVRRLGQPKPVPEGTWSDPYGPGERLSLGLPRPEPRQVARDLRRRAGPERLHLQRPVRGDRRRWRPLGDRPGGGRSHLVVGLLPALPDGGEEERGERARVPGPARLPPSVQDPLPRLGLAERGRRPCATRWWSPPTATTGRSCRGRAGATGRATPATPCSSTSSPAGTR